MEVRCLPHFVLTIYNEKRPGRGLTGDWKVRGQNPGWGKEISSKSIHTGCGAHTVSSTIANGVLARGRSSWGVTLTNPAHPSSAAVRNQ